jgi:mannose-6-phosphate isomerase-like protein (cupin superfamily)
MLIKDLLQCKEFVAGDRTILRQILHPDNEKLAIRYSLAHAVVKPGDTSQLHALKTSEVYYILEGEGEMRIDDEQKIIGPGQVIYIPPYAPQCIRNSGGTDLKFLCIVDPAWREEDEVIL